LFDKTSLGIDPSLYNEAILSYNEATKPEQSSFVDKIHASLQGELEEFSLI